MVFSPGSWLIMSTRSSEFLYLQYKLKQNVDMRSLKTCFRRLTISNRMRTFLWLSTAAVGLYSMYSVTFYYIPTYQYSQLESALYNSLHRLGWSLFTGWTVLACVTSDSGSLRTFLSSRALVPLSRLTYCAYLTNGFIELYLAASIRTPKFMSVTNLVIAVALSSI